MYVCVHSLISASVHMYVCVLCLKGCMYMRVCLCVCLCVFVLRTCSSVQQKIVCVRDCGVRCTFSFVYAIRFSASVFRSLQNPFFFLIRI